ncbi:MAG: hypothetical protein AAGL98_00165 [Planctomycetota bacterium]
MTLDEVQQLCEGDQLSFRAGVKHSRAIADVVTENYVRVLWTGGNGSDIVYKHSPIWEAMEKR